MQAILFNFLIRLLGESSSSFAKGEGVENMESELHSAAIDTGSYEKEKLIKTIKKDQISEKVNKLLI